MRSSLKDLHRLQRNLGLKPLKPSRSVRATKPGSALEAEFARQLRAEGITGWTREYKFHPERRFRLDFAWPAESVSVEIQGGTFSDGAHTRGAGYAANREKSNLAQILGWVVLEVDGEQVKCGKALEWLQQALAVSEGSR